jgi:chemotaxis protein CheC
MLDLSSFNNLQLDAIREVGNIGTGNAATALSQLLSCMIEMDVPKADLVSIYALSEYYGDPNTLVGAVFVRSLGDFGCSLIFIQNEEDAAMMVDLLLKQQFGGLPKDNFPQDMLDSAFAELGNIILSSFLNAISMLIGIEHQISVPGVAHDMLASILDVVASIFGQLGDMALVVNTGLRVGGVDKDEKKRNISGHIVMLPDPDALELLLRKLQVL